MTTIREIQEEIKAFYRVNGLNELGDILILSLGVLGIICAHTLTDITAQHGWLVAIFCGMLAAVLLVHGTGWILYIIFVVWLYYWRNKSIN